ncbi:hypothetical protein ABK040_009547 [Willaertia magna]
MSFHQSQSGDDDNIVGINGNTGSSTATTDNHLLMVNGINNNEQQHESSVHHRISSSFDNSSSLLQFNNNDNTVINNNLTTIDYDNNNLTNVNNNQQQMKNSKSHGDYSEMDESQPTLAERENISTSSLKDMDQEEEDVFSDDNDIKEQTNRSLFRKYFVFIDYPIAVWFIILNELCERFAYYGFKTILSLYLKNYLLFDEDAATAINHAFMFFAYLTPLIGGFLADALIGKYWTIVGLGSIYCVGQIIVSITAIDKLTGDPPHWWGAIIGLILVAFGTGGIKSSVSTMGGDQFKANQTELLASFFSIFYFSINLGSMVSSFISPIIRTNFGYSVAFAVPAILLVIAIIIFAIGKRWYKNVPPTGFRNNPIFVFCNINLFALKETFKRRRGDSYQNTEMIPSIDRESIDQTNGIEQENANSPSTNTVVNNSSGIGKWLDKALVKYSQKEVYDVKSVWSVIIILLPIVIFWSLFDQHSSRFVFQAELMNRKVGSYEFGADQITTLNPLLVICLVIVFDRFIYKLASRLVNPTPLRKIAIGMVITALSFVAAAIVEIFVQLYPNQVHVAWQIPQYVLLSVGEILVSVTGLEFAYSQAPKEMKSLMQAYYLLTVSMGNVVVVIVALIRTPKYIYKQVIEFSLFAFLMVVALGIFILLARRYKYRNIKERNISNNNGTENQEEQEIEEKPKSMLQEEEIIESRNIQ